MGRKKAKILKKKCERLSCDVVFEYKDTKRGRQQLYCSYKCSNFQKNLDIKHSDEHNKKISESLLGEKNPFWGKHLTKEHKDKIGRANKGKLEDRFGKEKANEIKAKISDAIRGEKNGFYGKHHTNTKKLGRDVSGKKNPMFGKGYLIKGERNGAWQGGISFGEYGEEFTLELRTEIRKRDKFTCQVCYKNGYVVHHIDYIKNHNEKENLITTCNSCHAKTNFNRDYWQQYFKNKIRVIYG
ncbi:MAG: hypothetical protein JETCAE03_32220 [Ignavibacteriaceae bacterium]|jgi:hypothetical protein|nr:MAG: hypothetical protein JETCAE03_32220 [Ignavibacteriaceae bacterium]